MAITISLYISQGDDIVCEKCANEIEDQSGGIEALTPQEMLDLINNGGTQRPNPDGEIICPGCDERVFILNRVWAYA